MKKFITFIALALTILTACADKNLSDEPKKVLKEPKIYEYEAKDFKFDCDFSKIDVKSVSRFSDEDLEIEFKEIRNIENSFVVNLKIKNISDEEIYLIADDCAIDGYLNHVNYEKRLKPQESDNARFIFYDLDLNKHMIEDVSEIMISIAKVKDDNFSQFIKTDKLFINLDNEAKSELNYRDFDLIYDENDIKIYNMGFNLENKHAPGYDYMLFIENNSDEAIFISEKDLGKVEDSSEPFYFDFYFPPMTKQISHIYFHSYDGDKAISSFEIDAYINDLDDNLIDILSFKFEK
ncbi:MAG: hypothetical protein Q4P29_02460 [Tissierellia bacterium]|nr:hypothetical protein [Tissierellia bacterium]